MPGEKDFFEELHFMDYEIAGNKFRAWFAPDDKLIFVLDVSDDVYKPNALLVIDRHDDRKWDDVLANDYGVDLEEVRPKKDNKYQKLDVEYSGLDVYEKLIDAYENTDAVDNAIAELIDFRDAAVRRSAMARLNVANDAIDVARDTILRTQNSVHGLTERRRRLRVKLSKCQESGAGETTKQSAAKILKVEAQLESVAEKLERAERRMENAQRRMDIAVADAESARELLALPRRTPAVDYSDIAHDTNDVDVSSPMPQYRTGRISVARHTGNSHVARRNVDNVDDDNMDSADVATMHEGMEKISDDDGDNAVLPVPEYDFKLQQEDEEMSDSEEVKPLFDQDPEILDEEIAFKPVEFENIRPAVDSSMRPMSPIETENVSTQNDSGYDTNPLNGANDTSAGQNIETAPELYDNSSNVAKPEYTPEHPMGPRSDVPPVVAPAPQPTVNTATRPMSPITGGDVRPVGQKSGRPTLIYYVLLIILIVLSVFTLWLYQQKNGGTVPFPDVGAKTVVAPDIIDTVNTPDTISEPIVEPEPEPVPSPIAEDVTVADINIEYPSRDVLMAAEPAPVVVESEQDVLMRKDAYNVATDDKVFLVPETHDAVSPVPEPVVTTVVAPDVIIDDDIVSVPTPVVNTYVNDTYDANNYIEDTTVVDTRIMNDYDTTNDVVMDVSNDVYYQNGTMPQYDDYVEDVDAGYYDAHGAVYQESNPERTKHLTVHDGGQYSVIYEETKY